MMEVVDAKLLFKLIISVLYVSVVDSVSFECQTSFNSSDCGLPSTAVYTYYSLGAFCHPHVWRGCPTNNKFENEEQCLQSCLTYFVVTDPFPKKMDVVKTNMKSQSVKIDRCVVPLNTSRCTNQVKLVYTFSDIIKSCVTALWSGCPTENMFPDITSCQDNCQKMKDNKMKHNDKSNVEKASNVLQLMIKKSNAPNKETKLMQNDEYEKQVPIDRENLMKRSVETNEDNKIEQNDKSKVQNSSNVPKKFIKKVNALKKANKQDEKDIFKVRKVPNIFKKLIEKMEALEKGKRSGKNIDLDAKAYFIYKLVRANIELDERREHGDIDMMLLEF